MKSIISKCVPIMLALMFLAQLSAHAQWGERIWIGEREYRVAPPNELREQGIEVPDVQFFRNSAVEYLNAINAYIECPEEIRELYRHIQSKGEWKDEYKELGKWIDSNSEMIEELKNAEEKEFFVFPIFKKKDDPVSSILLPHLSRFREMARFLKVCSKYQMSKGDFKGALESWLITMRMSEHVNEEPFLISGLVAVSLRSIAEMQIRDVVLREELTTAQLDDLSNMLGPFYEDPLQFGKAAESEMNFMLQGLKELFGNPKQFMDLYGLDPDPLTLGLLQIGQLTPVPRLMMESNIRVYWGKMKKVFELPLVDFMKYHNGRLSELGFTEIEKPWGLASIFTEGYSGFRMQYARNELQSNVLMLTIILQKYRKQNGRYPEELGDLEDIVEEIPFDVYTGEDFIYTAGDNDYIFYSLGQDLKDNGGDIGKSSVWRGKDYVFTNKVEPYEPFVPREEE